MSGRNASGARHWYKNGKLHETAEFRSHDMYRGWHLNAYALRELLKRMSEEVGMNVGTLSVLSNSAHIYEDCWVSADKTIEMYHRNKPMVVENDPRGYFLVTADEKSGEITVQHARNKDGKKSKLCCFRRLWRWSSIQRGD